MGEEAETQTSSLNSIDGNGLSASGRLSDDIYATYSNSIRQIRLKSSQNLQPIRAAVEPPVLKRSSERGQEAGGTDLPSLLEEAAARLETHSAATTREFEAAMRIQDPLKMQKELHRIMQQATIAHAVAAEIEHRSVHFLEKEELDFLNMLSSLSKFFEEAIAYVEHECSEAARSMAAQIAAAEVAYLKRLTDRKDAFRLEFNSKLTDFASLCDILREKRLELRANQEKGLNDVQAREHAAHDALWLQLSQQATELACKLCAARMEQMTLKDKLIYNCRVLAERFQENRAVSTEFRRRLNNLEVALVSLRARYAEEKSSAAAEKEQLQRDAERAVQALATIVKKRSRFQVADEAEIRQLVVLKEESINKMIAGIHDAQGKITKLSRGIASDLGYQGSAPTKAMVPAAAVKHQDKDYSLNDAQKEEYWLSKLRQKIPEGLKEELKRLEVAVREALK